MSKICFKCKYETKSAFHKCLIFDGHGPHCKKCCDLLLDEQMTAMQETFITQRQKNHPLIPDSLNELKIKNPHVTSSLTLKNPIHNHLYYCIYENNSDHTLRDSVVNCKETASNYMLAALTGSQLKYLGVNGARVNYDNLKQILHYFEDTFKYPRSELLAFNDEPHLIIIVPSKPWFENKLRMSILTQIVRTSYLANSVEEYLDLKVQYVDIRDGPYMGAIMPMLKEMLQEKVIEILPNVSYTVYNVVDFYNHTYLFTKLFKALENVKDATNTTLLINNVVYSSKKIKDIRYDATNKRINLIMEY